MKRNLLLLCFVFLFLSTLYIMYLRPKTPSPFTLVQYLNHSYDTKVGKQTSPSSPLTQPLQHLQAVCAAGGRMDHAVEPPNLLHWSVEPKSKLIMCRTAKHGSTSWANIFVRIYSQGFAGDLEKTGF